PGLQPGLEPRSCRNGNERLAKGGKPFFVATGRLWSKNFSFEKNGLQKSLKLNLSYLKSHIILISRGQI
ncbi:hypothetical protein, partial [Treponema sp.]|uniref:hypothetical protein n=1 Tax=Treponema sp. TaxID=166 RepID=UPI003FD87251